jgi:formamidopyrimidine-DNA glycosylase
VSSTLEAFTRALTRENHTLKRALTDPHLLSGIGNAYSDEILHAAKLSPMKLTSQLTAAEIDRLHEIAVDTLLRWRDTLVAESGDAFPTKVTAFRPTMAVHGRFGQKCPACGTAVQRIVYASNEANYCPSCQTGGRLLADRSLSRLMKGDWPRTLEELERKKESRRG